MKGKTAADATTRVAATAEVLRTSGRGSDRTATSMATTRAATPPTAAPTWMWLASVAATSGGSFGMTPATTAATPANRTNPAPSP